MTLTIIPDDQSAGWQVIDTARRNATVFVIDVTRGSISIVADTDQEDTAVIPMTPEALGLLRECIDRVLAAYQPPDPVYEPVGVRGAIA